MRLTNEDWIQALQQERPQAQHLRTKTSNVSKETRAAEEEVAMVSMDTTTLCRNLFIYNASNTNGASRNVFMYNASSSNGAS